VDPVENRKHDLLRDDTRENSKNRDINSWPDSKNFFSDSNEGSLLFRLFVSAISSPKIKLCSTQERDA